MKNRLRYFSLPQQTLRATAEKPLTRTLPQSARPVVDGTATVEPKGMICGDLLSSEPNGAFHRSGFRACRPTGLDLARPTPPSHGPRAREIVSTA